MQLPEIRRRPVHQPVRAPDVPELLGRILAARGLETPEDTELSLARLPSPEGLPGLAEGVRLLRQVLEAGGRVLIVGDYDADGATAAALMMRGLAMLGFEQPGFLVPDRFEYGYGLSPEIVELALAEGSPDLIITVDNGISSVEGVQAARAAGIAVLITDHHLPGEELPDADAIVNPRLSENFEGENLAGVGVAFYLLLALRAALRDAGDLETQPDLLSLLDLVALGTVADVVLLDRTNRVLVEQGLRRIRAGAGVPGIRALLEVGKRNPDRAVAADLGFAAGPRLNAAGRLTDMSHGILALLSDDERKAREYAEELDGINRERRGIEQGMRDEALKQVERLRGQGDLPDGLCLHDPHWHEGVVGIVASRVKDAVNRPVIAFAPAGEPGQLKGSARSIPGLHMRDVLAEVATRHPDMLQRFGGHAMAAGLTLDQEALEAFRQAFRMVVSEQLPPGALEPVVETDGQLPEEQLELSTAELLTHGFPWGQGFPPPCFEGEFEVLEQKVVGERHLKFTLGLPSVKGVIDGIHFNAEVERWPGRAPRVRGIYRLEVNEFRGQRRPQLVFTHLVPVNEGRGARR